MAGSSTSILQGAGAMAAALALGLVLGMLPETCEAGRVSALHRDVGSDPSEIGAPTAAPGRVLVRDALEAPRPTPSTPRVAGMPGWAGYSSALREVTLLLLLAGVVFALRSV